MARGAFIEPDGDQLAALVRAAGTEPGPVVMLNLLRFEGPEGAARYAEYGAAVQPHLDRVGASITYAGLRTQVVIGEDDDGWWDAVVLVRYPSRAAMVEMVTHPDYAAVGAIRSAALSSSALIATDPWEIELA
ncbi:MAG: DUF1330 domain-containing protein [Marmoricola sp.]